MGDQWYAARLSKPETNEEETWTALRRFYVNNFASIERSRSVNVAHDQIHEHLEHVLETSEALLDGFVTLANIHPVIGVAVFAFHGIIKLDIARRENNRKVLAVKLQMLSMMCTLFQLCDLKHSHILDGPQKQFQRNQLQRLLKTIAGEITKCGSDLSYYSERKPISKFFNAKMYERLFAQHVQIFALRRSELQTILTAYISAGIDSSNVAIGQVGQKVEVVDKKIESLLEVFRRLDTPSERDARQYLDDLNGGPDKCLKEDALLSTLLEKAGQPVEPKTKVVTLKAVRTELGEDLNNFLSANLSRFEGQLAVQTSNLERVSKQIEEQSYGLADHGVKLDKLLATSISILEEGKLVRKTVVPNALIRLKDPELQGIWDGMGLSNRRNVKAKRFVLSLRDYLISTDRYTPTTPELRPVPSLESSPSNLTLVNPVGYRTTHPPSDSAEPNAWVLKHITAANIQPLIEALDEDGSGFISVQEANRFALSRPKYIGLLHWFAYWAAGWRYNIANYRIQIYTIMQQLDMLRDDVLASNRQLFLTYLDDWDYFRIEGILRHISDSASNIPRDSELAEVAAKIAKAQEERLKKNLDELSYVLKSSSDVALVIGTWRLETCLLPLLCILLSRHLEIFRIGRSRTLNSLEFSTHRTSIESIMESYNDRTQHLRATFRPVGRDTVAHFRNFACGMFVEAYKWTDSRIADGNTLLSFIDEAAANSHDDDTGLPEPAPDSATPDTSVLWCRPGVGSIFPSLADIDRQSSADSVAQDDTSPEPTQNQSSEGHHKDYFLFALGA